MNYLNLTKWENPLNDRKLRNSYNNNIDSIVAQFTHVMNEYKRLESVMENIIINSGGDSPNEVVGSRVDSRGVIQPTLNARIKSDYYYQKEDIQSMQTQMISFATMAAELDAQLKKLYSADSGYIVTVDSNKGSDETGDGSGTRPYKTINKAVSEIPRIVDGDVIVYLVPGYYKEDVTFQGITAKTLLVRSTVWDSTDPSTGDTGCYVRSLTFRDIAGYVRVSGIQQYDHVNSGARYTAGGLNQPITLFFERVHYFLVDRCRFSENVRSAEGYAVHSAACRGRLDNNYFQNQYECLFANWSSHINVENTNTGKSNFRGVSSGRSIVQGEIVIGADEPIREYGGGRVFQ
ncbi:hypothetical protein [Terribacillus sp. 7520-G]|uniref:hypothetical protein n=1 Tax=Terribacillus sp. 7520-G TaxID=2025389 RepID=UPI000BA6CB53|nr:hypothetical protein [Terribacillus sp. 7520-G]PAD39823.1 hypothetical protein CHH53_04065 [Terribacillus sp. 7520-G]